MTSGVRRYTSRLRTDKPIRHIWCNTVEKHICNAEYFAEKLQASKIVCAACYTLTPLHTEAKCVADGDEGL